jgi:predicted house-cleaning NTP pyrophosphatase (Maf/HAM1 superfamily)
VQAFHGNGVCHALRRRDTSKTHEITIYTGLVFVEQNKAEEVTSKVKSDFVLLESSTNVARRYLASGDRNLVKSGRGGYAKLDLASTTRTRDNREGQPLQVVAQ